MCIELAYIRVERTGKNDQSIDPNDEPLLDKRLQANVILCKKYTRSVALKSKILRYLSLFFFF